MKYLVGLDVALCSLALCIIDADDKIALERALPCEIKDVAISMAAMVFGDVAVVVLGYRRGSGDVRVLIEAVRGVVINRRSRQRPVKVRIQRGALGDLRRRVVAESIGLVVTRVVGMVHCAIA